jgi:magnesium transporter
MAETLDLAVEFVRRQPRAAARALEQQPPSVVAAFLASVPAATACDLVSRMLPRDAVRIVALLDPENAAAVIRGLEPGNGAAILRHLPETARTRVLGRLPTRIAVTCRLLLRYSEGTVGAWMNPRALTLPDDITVEEALARLRREDTTEAGSIHVLNRAGNLRGVAEILDLLRADDAMRIAVLMRAPQDAVRGRATLDAVIDHPAWSEGDDLPVTDGAGKFIGALGHVEFSRAMRMSTPETPRVQVVESLVQISESYWSWLSVGAELVSALASGTSPDREEARR